MDYNIELLAPVGNMESLYAAIANGADAVYLGGKLFSARQFASNFDYDELKKIIEYAHLNQIKVYVTINILIDDNEMEEALDYIRFLYEKDVDAIIVQDLGLARNVRKLFPDLDIHASTQMTVNNLEGVNFLEDLGFKKVVLARETPLEEIKRIKKGSSIALEAFIHGALCVSYSGQCLMSSLIGGRSGNRGKCAQPCRMPYSIVDKEGKLLEGWDKLYLLSPKDLNTLDQVEKMIDAGISSLKIEGRMKRPEYVATIVRAYRKKLDKNINISKQTKEDVKQIFNRGFTKGLGLGDFGADFLSIDRPDNRGIKLGTVVNTSRDKISILLEKTLVKDDGIEFALVNGKYKGLKSPTSGNKGDIIEIKRIGNIKKGSAVYRSSSINLLKKAQESYKERKVYPITMNIAIKIGEKPSLKLSYEDYNIIIYEDYIVEEAKNEGLTKTRIKNQLSRLGDTQFILNHLNVDLDIQAFLPVSILNKMRRDAVGKLTKFLENKNSRNKFDNKFYKDKKKDILKLKKYKQSHERKLSVKVDSIGQLQDIDFTKVERIYIPLVDNMLEKVKDIKRKNIEIYINTEKILYANDFENFKNRLESIKDIVDGVSVNNIGTLKFIKENYNFKIHGDIGLNVFNSHTVEFLRKAGISSMTLSPELNLSQIKQIRDTVGGDLETIIYGYLPVMATKVCPMAIVKGCKDDKRCKTCDFANGYGLKDRMNKTFYMTRYEGFTNIYNSVPIMVLENINQIYDSGISMGRLDFISLERNIKEIQEAYYKYINYRWSEREIKRFVENFKNTTEITKGHFFRGVI